MTGSDDPARSPAGNPPAGEIPTGGPPPPDGPGSGSGSGSGQGSGSGRADAQAGALADWQRDFWLCLGFFTRLPTRNVAGSLAGAVRAFPLAGLVIGLIGALVYFVGYKIGLSALLAALLAVAATGIVTGALHEDGWADLCDALGARGGVQKRLEILRDSRLGSYGGLALVFATLIKVAALASLARPELVAGALIAAHVLGRAVLPLVMSRMSLARSEGLAAGAGRPTPAAANWSLAIGLVIAVIAVAPVAAIVSLIAALAATWLVARLAQKNFGGYTGDVLGAVEQVAEMAILINLVTLI